MVETYKYKSKIATAISFIAAAIVYIGKDELTKVMPTEYAFLAGFIVLLAGFIVTQGTENKRVNIAEQIVYEQMAKENIIDPTEPVMNDEYECGCEEDGC